MSLQSFYSHGKLMLTGEYAVLDGAKALAIPTRFGQKMTVETKKSTQENVFWRSVDVNGNNWLEANFKSWDLRKEQKQRLKQLIDLVEEQKPTLFTNKEIFITTTLEFPSNWGLGSSSTLISLLAQWSGVNAFELLKNSFGGSGYDVACAQSDSPISYQIKNGIPTWETVTLQGDWIENAYFVFLEQKKNSREAIAHYKTLQDTSGVVAAISSLMEKWLVANTYQEVYAIINEHEKLMSKTLLQPSINDQFSDLDGICKSLGAWGGDFILVLSQQDEETLKNYFANKGFNTLLTYNEMIWKP